MATTPQDKYHDSMMSHLVNIDELTEDDLSYLSEQLSDLAFSKRKQEPVSPMWEYGRNLLKDMESIFAPYLSKN